MLKLLLSEEILVKEKVYCTVVILKIKKETPGRRLQFQVSYIFKSSIRIRHHPQSFYLVGISIDDQRSNTLSTRL